LTEENGTSTFEVRGSDLAGRIGIYSVNGRKVETPELMPVVNPNRMTQGSGVLPRELFEDFGFGIVITNSYIIRRSNELSEQARRGGLHRLLDFPGIIMTDSGTFQSYMYGGGYEKEVKVDPLEIVSFQNSIGSDIGTILDKFTVPERDHIGAEKDLEITLERARSSIDVNSGMELAVPVQGGRFPDLRIRSGRSVFELGVGYAPIGGVVPIMERYDYSLLVDVIVSSKKGLGPSIPAHLFGAGHPMILPLAAALGCDLFDSASYAKFANDDRYMMKHRTLHLKELENLYCSCPICVRRDPGDLLELEREERRGLVSRHNLWVLRDIIREIRGAIKEGTLWEMVERSAMYNPSMYAAVRRLKEHAPFLEENSPRSTRRFMASSGLSLSRPEFTRMRIALNDHVPPYHDKKSLILTNWTLSHSYNTLETIWRKKPEGTGSFMIHPFGLMPYDIVDMYPISQSIFPPPDMIDDEMRGYMDDRISWSSIHEKEHILWNGEEELVLDTAENDIRELDLRKTRSILRFQFGSINGKWSDRIILPEDEDVSFVRSKKTGKIRNIFGEGSGGDRIHLLSMRAEDGLFNLKWEAARRLHVSSDPPYRRIIVEEGTGDFNAKGYNVFCKFVMDADPMIRAGDDVLIVDREDVLFAVGRATVSARMMVEAKVGTAVKIRDGAEKQGASP
jgi:7-cyano-7-deazaguanine tRNA-ribosyltransferase